MHSTAEKVTNLYDLMDSAYDVPAIIEVSQTLGHVPLIDTNPRRNKELKANIEAEAKARKTLNWSLLPRMFVIMPDQQQNDLILV